MSEIIIDHPKITSYFKSKESLTNFILAYLDFHMESNIIIENRSIESSDLLRDIHTKISNPDSNNLLKEIHSKLFGSNSTKIGQIGETTVESILTESFPTYEFSHREQGGDFILKSPSHKFAVEVKNYSRPVPQAEIDKFIRDIKTLDCDGIFISKGGICGKTNFSFENVDGYFIIYIIGFDKTYILAAHSLLLNLPRNSQNIKQFTDEEIENIINDYHKMEQTKNMIIQNAQNILNVAMKISFDSLSKLIETKVDTENKCLLCEKIYKTQRGLKNHMSKVHQSS